MNAKSQTGFELIYRKIEPQGKTERHYVRRVLELDETSKVMAIPKYFDRRDSIQEIWVAYTKGEDLHMARIEFVTGELLEVIHAMNVFPKK